MIIVKIEQYFPICRREFRINSPFPPMLFNRSIYFKDCLLLKMKTVIPVLMGREASGIRKFVVMAAWGKTKPETFSGELRSVIFS